MSNFEGFGFEEAGAVTESQVVSGRAVIGTRIDINAGTYDLEIDGAIVDNDINFSASPAELSMVRFMTWHVNTFRFSGRRFEYVLVRPLINPEPTVSAAGADSKPASCP